MMTQDEMNAAMAAPCANVKCGQPADKCRCNDAQEVKMTQKQTLANLKTQAAHLNMDVTIRKNSYGEYEVRVKRFGTRANDVYFSDSFEDAVATAQVNLDGIREAQEQEMRNLDAAYERSLRDTIWQFEGLFQRFGCRITRHNEYVNLWSPKTGSHNLTMRRGVRPVSDLVAHACGFIEQQTHRQ